MIECEILHKYEENWLIYNILPCETVKSQYFDEKSIRICAKVIIKILRSLSAND